MALNLRDYFAFVTDEYEETLRAPLSLRRAILSASLLNNLPDRIFAAHRSENPGKVWNAQDLLEYRSRIEDECRDIAIVHALAQFKKDGPQLVRETIPVPESETEKLSLGDFMISLYNGVMVQAVLIRMPDRQTLRFHDVIGRAIDWWKSEFERRKF